MDNSRTDSGEDASRGNWLTRNAWMLKGFAVAAVLVALSYVSLSVFGNELGNVLWAISVTLAALVVLVQAFFGVLQLTQSA